MVVAAQLIAQVTAIGVDQAKSQLDSMGNSVDNTAGVMRMALGGAALAAGAAIVGFGAKSVQMAADFQTGMTSLVTGAGESAGVVKDKFGNVIGGIDMVRQGILKMAVDTGTSTQQLTSGMYMIESAGFHGAAGLAVLQAASEGAKVGNADLGVVAGAVTTVMHDYASSNISATQATNALVTTVSDGKTHMQDLSNSLATVLPLASSLHIPFQQVAGAIATMTNAGMPAQRATQNLSFAIRSLNTESKAGSDALTSIGLSATEVHDDLVSKGLPDTLQMIEDHLGKKFPLSSEQGQASLKAILGGATGLNVALMIGGSHMKEYQSDIASIGSALTSSSKDVQGWSDVQNTFNFKLSQAQEVIETLMIKLGTELLPIVGKAIGIFSNLATWIGNSVDPIQVLIPILAGLGAIVAGTLVPAFWAWASAMIAATWPLLLVGAAVAGLVAIFMHFYSTNAGFRDFINEIGKALQQFAGVIMNDVGAAIKFLTPYFQEAAKAIEQFGTEVGQRIQPILQNFFGSAKGGISGFASVWNAIWPSIADVLKGVWDQIVGIVKIAWALLTGVIKIGLDLLSGNWGQAWNDFKTMLSGVWDGIKQVVKGSIEQLVGQFRPLLEAMANIPGPAGDMAKKVLSYFDSMTQGAQQSSEQMKEKVIANQVQMHEKAVSELEAMRQQIIQKIQDTSDPVVQKMLEMKEKSVDQMIQMQEQATSKAAAMKSGVVQNTQDMQDQVVGHSIIPDMVNSIISWLGQLPGRALSAVSSMASSLGGFFSNLASQALTWGSDMISNFTNGISNAAGGLIAKAQSIASNIASILHFSKPDIGPLADADKWMPDMMSLLAEGINQNLGKVKSAALNVSATIASPTNQSSFAPSTGGGLSGGSLQGLSVVPSSVSSSTGPIQITVQPAPVYLDGRLLAGGLMPYITSAIRSATGTKTF